MNKVTHLSEHKKKKANEVDESIRKVERLMRQYVDSLIKGPKNES